MAKTPRAPTNMSILFTRRRFFEATRTPAPATLGQGGRFPAVVVTDSTAPSVPTGLAGTAQSPNQIDLSWNASTDAGTGVAGYRLYRDGGIAPIADQTGLTFSDTGLTASTQYAYRISAYDNSGNESAQSTAVQVTTQASGTQTINVSTVSALVNAVSVANNSSSPTVIVLADGTYQLSSFLNITADNLTIKSASGNRANVIIRGDAISANANVLFIFRIEGDGFLAQDLTIGGRCRFSAIQIVGESGSSNGIIRNCIVQDSYEHLLKSSTDEATGSTGWIVEDCLFRFTAGQAPAQYNGGIDVHLGTNWIVRRCTFQDIASPATSACQHAVNFWNGSTGCLIERCKAIDCDRGFGDGLSGNTANNNNTIRNCMVSHADNGDAFADVGISVENATNSKVYNNSVYLAHSITWAMEYRFTTTGAEFRNNLCNKQILARDGGTATLSNNVTTATAGYFTNVTTGDLTLATSVAGVVDSGATIATVTNDYDGESRPQGASYDIGADEYTGAVTPLNLPLATSANLSITYLGFITMPTNQDSGGIGLSIDAANGKMYMQGLSQNTNFFRMTIPSLSGTATRDAGPVSVTGSVGSSTEVGSGSLVYNGRFFSMGRLVYDGSGFGQTAVIKAWSGLGLTGQGAYCSISTPRGTYARNLASGLAHIPSTWQPVLGGGAMMLGGRMSIVTAACMGYGMGVFDPDSVSTSGGTVAVNDLLNYTSAHPLEPFPPTPEYNSYPKNSSGGTDLYSVANAPLGTAFIPSGSRSLIFVTVHGYGTADNGCRPGSSVNNSPFRVQLVAYDLRDIVDVKNGLKQNWEPQPYNFDVTNSRKFLELTNATNLWGACVGSENSNAGPGWAVFDYTTNRLYGCAAGLNGGERRIHVWQVGTV